MKHAYQVANIISIEDGKVLLVKKRDFWILPGGKIYFPEEVSDCIKRELAEELPGSRLEGDLVYYDKFYGNTPSKKKIKVVCYFGKIEGDITPSAEISDARYFSGEDLCNVFKNDLSEITAVIVWRLICQKYL